MGSKCNPVCANVSLGSVLVEAIFSAVAAECLYFCWSLDLY